MKNGSVRHRMPSWITGVTRTVAKARARNPTGDIDKCESPPTLRLRIERCSGASKESLLAPVQFPEIRLSVHHLRNRLRRLSCLGERGPPLLIFAQRGQFH